ncbi:MAG: SpoIID/LytB domain-containing protein [Bdellovibrionales bacterium]|nr:SpoIID/LytB domain-containing protein [Bdellovibrionales bacterium]MBT3526256.1 SpoIID/LytB domain-containing protein [Bdellovibrionales bacterium]MBT7670482.1 SpoIID/LytB domain-containing protein [Bdellovibrionales bacterium]
MKLFRFFYLALFSSLILVGVEAKIRVKRRSANRKIPMVRVLIGKGLANLTVTGNGLSRKLLSGVPKSYRGYKSILFRCGSGQRLQSTGNLQSRLLASVSVSKGEIQWNLHGPYRGVLHLAGIKGSSGCDLINEVDLETYLESLLSNEMNAKWPIEVLKAQAVAARSYAYFKMKNQEQLKRYNLDSQTLYHLENSERDQVAGDYSFVTPRTKIAAGQTRGEILVGKQDNELTPIFFHAKCGGRTMIPQLVWGNRVGSYSQVECPFCHQHGKRDWSQSISLKQFRRFLSWVVRKEMGGERAKLEGKITLLPDSTASDRLRIYLGPQLYLLEKPMLRRYFGRKIFSSNNFMLVIQNNRIKISGRGLGHGVGMCQLGALDLAQQGWGYRQILSYYFPLHKLQLAY